MSACGVAPPLHVGCSPADVGLPPVAADRALTRQPAVARRGAWSDCEPHARRSELAAAWRAGGVGRSRRGSGRRHCRRLREHVVVNPVSICLDPPDQRVGSTTLSELAQCSRTQRGAPASSVCTPMPLNPSCDREPVAPGQMRRPSHITGRGGGPRGPGWDWRLRWDVNGRRCSCSKLVLAQQYKWTGRGTPSVRGRGASGHPCSRHLRFGTGATRCAPKCSECVFTSLVTLYCIREHNHVLCCVSESREPKV